MKNLNRILTGITFFILPILLSCNYQLSELKKENAELSRKVDSLSDALLYYKLQETDSHNQKKSYSSYDNQRALSEFLNHLGFYCKNCDYKDFKVRKSGDNTFDISMNKRSNAKYVENGWTGVVIRITFNDNGKYTIKNLKGTYDFGCQ